MPARKLFVIADDFGIGPETSRAILELGQEELLTGTTLLVTSAHAAEAVQAWKDADRPLSLGWHPCLTMDRPLSADVPSLVDAHGNFFPLGTLLKKLFLKQIARADVERELRLQYERYLDLVGAPPELVNGHHHIHIFEPIRSVLIELLNDTKPYLRRVVEPWRCFWQVPGVRLKRRFLSAVGVRSAKHQAGFPGADELLGITDPPFVGLPDFFPKWLRASRAGTVELMVHPGYHDATIDGRDGSTADGQLTRRVTELTALRAESFRTAIKQCGFELLKRIRPMESS
jgi:predicted glycoside hydrolase/deacetylase ChbG (UPF0249 family)